MIPETPVIPAGEIAHSDALLNAKLDIQDRAGYAGFCRFQDKSCISCPILHILLIRSWVFESKMGFPAGTTAKTRSILLFCLCFLLTSKLFSSDSLKNIQQLTYPSMGFEKAGEAYFSPDGRSIAFQAVPQGKEHYQIYVMDLETKTPAMVSTGSGACTCAYFHPSENKIIFASSHENPNEEPPKTTSGSYKWDLTPYMNIYEKNLSEDGLKPLTSGPAYHAECAYSPDGSKIVYASNEDGAMNIYTMNSDGSDVRQLTHTSHCYNGGPFFSPDGNSIVYRADKETPHYLQIYTIDSDGSNERQITCNNAVNWAPYWHPNGSVIAYTTSLHGHHCYQIYLVNIETNTHSRLTHTSKFEGLPSFSKDGSKILWTSKSSEDGSCQIFIADFTLPQELY